MSLSSAKGREGENFFLPMLQRLFGIEIPKPDGTTENSVQRRKAGVSHDLGDFTGVPWLHESKNVVTPRFLEWFAQAAAKVTNDRWVVMWKGDRRKKRSGPYVTMPAAFYEELVDGYLKWQRVMGYAEKAPGTDPVRSFRTNPLTVKGEPETLVDCISRPIAPAHVVKGPTIPFTLTDLHRGDL